MVGWLASTRSVGCRTLELSGCQGVRPTAKLLLSPHHRHSKTSLDDVDVDVGAMSMRCLLDRWAVELSSCQGVRVSGLQPNFSPHHRHNKTSLDMSVRCRCDVDAMSMRCRCRCRCRCDVDAPRLRTTHRAALAVLVRGIGGRGVGGHPPAHPRSAPSLAPCIHTHTCSRSTQ